jgi:hypothetical protein
VINGSSSSCPISARPAFIGTRRIAPVAAISHVKAEGAQPVVEILRPAQRHFASLESETVQIAHAGAPFAPFLAQFLVQDQSNELTTAIVADRYEAAAALNGEPHRICVATV